MILPLTSETRALDMATCAAQQITSFQLMERAARGVTAEIMRRWPAATTRCHVMAGPGNNGGDALVVLRLLHEAGYAVGGCLFSPERQLSPDCATARDLLPAGLLTEVSDQFVMPDVRPGDLMIDGLFGSGLNRSLDGSFAYLVQFMNQSGATIVSIDIPSGLMGESNFINDYRAVVRASLTLTFTTPKVSFLMPENAPYVGEWQVLDIQMDGAALAAGHSPYRIITRADLHALLHVRDRFSHKGTYGSAWLAAGSRGMMGAALLAARACLRSGVGLLTVHTPGCGCDLLQGGIPEAKCECDAGMEHLSRLLLPEGCTALGIGPGLGQHIETARALQSLLPQLNRPAVLDADALNILAAYPDLLKLLKSQTLLTPHPKEADRLLRAAYQAGFLRNRAGSSPAEMDERNTAYDRLQRIRCLAQELRVVIVLKGTYTAVCLPDGTVWFQVECGHPGMAVGGSGDVLTGLILGLLAQHYRLDEAAILSVYLHALAADCALAAESYESWLPSDLIAHLGEAFKRISLGR